MSVKGDGPRPKRPYVSPLRRQQAREVAERIVESARGLFEARGYVMTTMSDVAREAGVAERTVYAAFGSKRALLFAVVDAGISGDAGSASVADREWFRAVLDEPDPRRKIELFAAVIRGIHERTAAMFPVVQAAAAADPEAAATLHVHLEGQSADERLVVESLAKRRALRDELTKKAALETIWALTTPGFYAQIAERGWTPEQYERWLIDSLTRLLLR